MNGVTGCPRKQIAEQAAQWIIRIDDEQISVRDNRELLDWLSKSPIHIDEFLLASSMWAELNGLKEMVVQDIDELIAEAQQNVVPFTGSSPEPVVEKKRWRNRPSVYWSAAAAVLLSIGLLFWFPAQNNQYITGIGEQLTFTLSDGTTVHLNTLSEIEVAFTEESRQLNLVRGEALFMVAKDPNRVFRVTSGGVDVSALGTVFNVFRNDGTTQVTVVEGRVSVLPEKKTFAQGESGELLNIDLQASDIYAAGEQAIAVSNGDISRVEDPDIEKAVAWRERRLVFNGESLDAIAADFNRYNERKIEVYGDEIRQRTLTGTFNADDPESLVSFLEKSAKVEVVITKNRFVIGPPTGQ